MKVTLDIRDNKADFFMELVKNLDFVKKIETEQNHNKKQILKELKEAIIELRLIEEGKLKARPAKELLDEL
jgi:hypothetical protein